MLPKKLFCPKCLLPERDIAFKDDLTDFYNYILESTKSEPILTYIKYKQLYKNKKISMLHFCKRKEENAKEYYEVLFGEIQSFFFEEKITSKLFSIYTLYSIYYTQVTSTFYQVNTILEFLKGVNTLIKKLINHENIEIKKVGYVVYNMVKKMKNDDAFSIGVIPGLKSIILNKYLIPVEKKENVYSYTKEINNYVNELKMQQNNEKNDINITEQKNKVDLDYSLIKKNIINDIKEINMDKDDYVNFINNNYCNNELNMNDNINNAMNSNELYIGNNYLKKEDLNKGEITQLDFLFNKYIYRTSRGYPEVSKKFFFDF